MGLEANNKVKIQPSNIAKHNQVMNARNDKPVSPVNIGGNGNYGKIAGCLFLKEHGAKVQNNFYLLSVYIGVAHRNHCRGIVGRPCVLIAKVDFNFCAVAENKVVLHHKVAIFEGAQAYCGVAAFV